MGSSKWRQRSVPLSIAAGCYLLAFLQRPGWASSDTKINLHVEPLRFLSDVASVWTSTGALGHVQGGQYGGYLFPMGPFFALGDLASLPAWVTHRLWLGTVLALGAWGVIRLLDALLSRQRGLAHAAAAILFVLNPYVVTFANRTSITLLGYALLPWLLLAVHQGVRSPRSWWWPVALALLVTSSGGGVNAAVTALMLIGPLLLLLYEPIAVGVPWKNVYSFLWRSLIVGTLASIWWIVPVLMQSSYGVDFLQFTEQPGTIWGTTSAPEVLRQLGYWVSYIGVGYGGELKPYFNDARVLLFNPLAVVATLLVPALALTGFLWTRRWRYGPFFLLITLVGVLVVAAGFPDGKPLRLAMNFIYNHVAALQFLRTTYKAAPLISLGIAVLGGVALAELLKRVRLSSHASRAGHLAPIGAVVLAAALVALSAWPLVRGKAVDQQMTWKEIPSAWSEVGRDLDRELPRNERALVLPGQLFAFYRWGGTVDPILPVMTKRPVAVRSIVPYADLRSIDLLWSIDSLVQQERLLLGQLKPLLKLLAVGAVVVATDDDRARSGQIQPAEASRVLSGQLPRTPQEYGPRTTFQSAAGTLGSHRLLPQVSRYTITGSRGIVRLEPQANPLVVDGGAAALLQLAAFDDLPDDRAILYAADLSAAQLKKIVDKGGEVVISDSNRKRAFIASRLRQSVGTTQDREATFSEDAAVMNPFPTRGQSAQTVAEFDGARYIRAPFSPGFTQFPERRPYAAFDGNAYTSWLADPTLEVPRRYVEIGFKDRRDIPYIDLLPHSDSRGTVDRVEIDGKEYRLRYGWNRLRLGLKDVDSLQIKIAHVDWPKDRIGGAGGIAEVKIPGLKVKEYLRPPTLTQNAKSSLDRVSLSYLFERTTGDDPFRRTTAIGPPQAGKTRDRLDPESQLSRVFTPPVKRTYTARAWTTVDVATPDHELDRLVGYRGGYRFDSSSRFENAPINRASSAFTGRSGDAWIGGWTRKLGAWIQWRSPKQQVISQLRLTKSKAVVRIPRSVRIRFDGGKTGALPVSSTGFVKLPHEIRTRSVRIEILKAAFPREASGKQRQRRAVGIGQIEVAAMPTVAIPRRGQLPHSCDSAAIRVNEQTLGFAVRGSVQDLDRGRPLTAVSCGSMQLTAAKQKLTGQPRAFVVDTLKLSSPAPVPPSSNSTTNGTVLTSGEQGQGKYSGIRVDVKQPSWLVLGESYNKGWQAECNGRSLGESQPIDGYANGWQVRPGCSDVELVFGPNKTVKLGYLIGGALCLLLLLFLIIRRRPRRCSTGESFKETQSIEPDQTGRLPLRRAVAYGIAVGSVVAFVLALRAGLVAAPLLTLILWRGISTKQLILWAGGLLVLVSPVLSLIFLTGDRDRGGYNYGYAADQEIQHWVVMGGLFFLAMVLVRAIARARQ